MADGGVIRRRGEAPERFQYRQAMEQLANFIDNELGRVPRRPNAPQQNAPQRPDDREWRIQRRKTIEALTELGEKLDAICIVANYGKAAGNGAEILGAGGAMIGAVMALGGIKQAQLVINVANLINNAGIFLDGASGVVENLISVKYLSDIEKVLKIDQDLSRPLAEWLDFSNQLDRNIEQIFGVSLASEKFNTVMKVYYEFSKISSSVKGFDGILMLMRQGRYSVYIGNDVKLDRLEQFFQQISASPQIANQMRVVLSVLSASVGAIKFYREGVQAYRSLMRISSSSIVPSLQGGLNYLNYDIPTAGEVSVFCAFQAISLTRGAFSLINAANIIKHGKSKYSDAIRELIRALTYELRRMEAL